MIVFPKGIRLLNSDDLLGYPDTEELLKKVNAAVIEPGYIVHSSEDSKFQTFAEININPQQTWSLFSLLCERLLPEKSYCIIGNTDDENLFTSKYSDTKKLIELFGEFEFYLVNDCHIQIGIASALSEEFCEVFMTATKYLRIWTNKIDLLEDILKECNLIKKDDLHFIDEYPRATISLEYNEAFYGYQDLIDHLIKSTL
jgi:hypothetical protein